MKTVWFSVLVAPLMFCGCGGGGGPTVTVAPVSGVVMLKGAPVANPVVTFYPEKGPTGVGKGDDQGKFVIKTNGQLGAPVGKCKVTVVAANQADQIPEMDGNEAETATKPRLSAKYANPETTDLIIDVTDQGNEDLKLDLDE